MRVFITGGAGFIGSHLADHYVNAGHQVTILDNFSTGSKTNIAHLEGKITTLDGDIRNIELVESLIKADSSIKGMWCVPKYSNPTGVVYSDETVERIAKLGQIASANFRVFWDNAYSVHDLSPNAPKLAMAPPPHNGAILIISSILPMVLASATEAELAAMVRKEIGALACFKKAIIVKRLPKTRSGKILRKLLRQIAAGSEYSIPSTIDDPACLAEIQHIMAEKQLVGQL